MYSGCTCVVARCHYEGPEKARKSSLDEQETKAYSMRGPGVRYDDM